jgi:hypothetical protein
MIGAYTTSWGAWPQFYWRKKKNLYYDVCLKAKKIQIAQILEVTFRSPKKSIDRKNFAL